MEGDVSVETVGGSLALFALEAFYQGSIYGKKQASVEEATAANTEQAILNVFDTFARALYEEAHPWLKSNA